MGGGWLTFSQPVCLPGGEGAGAQGEVILSIDGHDQRWAVAMKPMPHAAMAVEAEFRRPADAVAARATMPGAVGHG